MTYKKLAKSLCFQFKQRGILKSLRKTKVNTMYLICSIDNIQTIIRVSDHHKHIKSSKVINVIKLSNSDTLTIYAKQDTETVYLCKLNLNDDYSIHKIISKIEDAAMYLNF